MVKYTGRGLVVERPGVLSKVQMLNLVLGVGGLFPSSKKWRLEDKAVLGVVCHALKFPKGGQKRHTNVWHINNISVAPVTNPTGRVPGRRKKKNIYIYIYIPWVPHTAHKFLTPGHPVGRPPPHPGSHRKTLFTLMCLFPLAGDDCRLTYSNGAVRIRSWVWSSLSLACPELGVSQRPLTLILLQKCRDTNRRRIVIQIGGVT